MLGRGVAEHIERGGPEGVWAPEVQEICRGCDLVICNLECCISARGRPTERIRGKPFFFRAPPVATRSLAAAGGRLVGLPHNPPPAFAEGAPPPTPQHPEAARL